MSAAYKDVTAIITIKNFSIKNSTDPKEAFLKALNMDLRDVALKDDDFSGYFKNDKIEIKEEKE